MVLPLVSSSRLRFPPLPQADRFCGAVVCQSPVLCLHRLAEDRGVDDLAEQHTKREWLFPKVRKSVQQQDEGKKVWV